jgi:FADH2 O2-dependent halogenase
VDASGPRGALARLLELGEAPFEAFPETEALFAHFTGVPRFTATHGMNDETPPYPPDDSALHHVFEGGWIWVLRFDNGITSAGAAVEPWLARSLHLEEGEPAWARLLERFPSVHRHLGAGRPATRFHYSPRLPWRCRQVVVQGAALLPSAAAFVDPLFSTGFTLTLLGVHRLARILEHAPGSARREEGLLEYARQTDAEATATARLVAASYASFHDFQAFCRVSMLYFVAASYSEMARRLERPELASSFLLQNQPQFAAAFARHTANALAGRSERLDSLGGELAPFNIAGLCDDAKRRWYGVDLNDVVRAAHRLQATPDEVASFFLRSGWMKSPGAGQGDPITGSAGAAARPSA